MAKAPDIVIQKRDIEFLQLLLHSRVLTLKHAAILLFNDSKEAAKKRIQKLKANGLVLERRRKAYEQGVLFLSKKGFECLKRHGALPDECADIPSFSKRGQISELTLQHELEVMDVKAAFYKDVKNYPNLSIAEFSTWPRLYEFSVTDHERGYGKKKTVKPDGFIRIHERDPDGSLWEHMFFLEVDRSTEKLETLVEKLRCYNLFYRQGGMAVRFGKLPDLYRDFPFKILLVCKTSQRILMLEKLPNNSGRLDFYQVITNTLQSTILSPLKYLFDNKKPLC